MAGYRLHYVRRIRRTSRSLVCFPASRHAVRGVLIIRFA